MEEYCPDDHDFDDRLTRALVSCGLSRSAAEWVWDEICRDYLVTLRSGNFDLDVLACLANFSLTAPVRFVFPSATLQASFDMAQQAAPAMVRALESAHNNRLARLRERGLEEFKPFDASNESLGAFAVRVEAAIGLAKGALLSVGDGRAIFVSPNGAPVVERSDFSAALDLLREAAPGVATYLLTQSL